MNKEKKTDEVPKGAVQLAPSILAADFARLGEQVAQAEQAGADRIHVDVMDGHFVPNISFGAPIIQSLRRVTRLPLETHLMISDPDFFLDEFVEAGSDSFLVHWEGNNNLHRTIQRIKALGKGVGVVINPATPAAVLEEILPEVDLDPLHGWTNRGTCGGLGSRPDVLGRRVQSSRAAPATPRQSDFPGGRKGIENRKREYYVSRQNCSTGD
jgi:Ribulose-phosphate 3 epimerase family